MRFQKRLLFVLFAVLGSGVGFIGPSKAITLPTFTWVVPCNDPDGVATDEVATDLKLAGGTYLVTTAGVCNPGLNSTFSASPGTPCTTTTTGPIPCATVTAQNLPNACWNSLMYVTVRACGPTGTSIDPNNCATLFGVQINETTCLPLGGAGLVTQVERPMRATFRDASPPTGFADNAGVFVVTAVLTPL